jgi:hypothetical protein
VRPVQNSFAKLGAEAGITLTVSVADSTETSQAKAGPWRGRSAGPGATQAAGMLRDAAAGSRVRPGPHRFPMDPNLELAEIDGVRKT